jgi:hypothetical protein
MGEVSAAKFSCGGCGKTYKWKPEFAGKKVKCKCGFVMTVSAAPPEPPGDEPDLDALYSLANEGKQAAQAGAVEVAIRCPSCKSQLEAGATVCPQCGFNLKTGSKSAPRAAGAAAAPGKGGAAVAAVGGKPTGATGAFAAFGAPKRGLQKDEPQDFKALDLYLPIGLLIGGIGAMTVRFMQFNPTNEPLMQALLYTGLKLVIMIGLMVVGAIFMIRFMEMAFGDPALAALKIAAVVLLPTAIAEIISFIIHDAPPTGWGLVGFFLAFGMFFILYHYLFDFDMSEMWIIVGYTTVACMLVARIAFEVVVGSSAGGSLASKGAQNDDAIIQYMIDLGRPKDAFEWTKESSGRMVGNETRADTEELLNGLKDAGGQEVLVAPVGPQAAEVYVKMPKDVEKRKAVIDFATQWNAKHKRGQAEDNGGKWFIMRFLPYEHPEPI